MAPRLQLEKAAWRWTETVPPEAVTQEHIEAAYRVGLEPCQRGTCRYGRARPELPAPGLASFPHPPSAVRGPRVPPPPGAVRQQPSAAPGPSGPWSSPSSLRCPPALPRGALPHYPRRCGRSLSLSVPGYAVLGWWKPVPLPAPPPLFLLPLAFSTPLRLPFLPPLWASPVLPALCFAEVWDAASPPCCPHSHLPHPLHLLQPRGSVPSVGDGWPIGCWSHRRNCRGNPNCLVGIGEHVWLGEIDENSFHNIDDPNCERRKKVQPAPCPRMRQGNTSVSRVSQLLVGCTVPLLLPPQLLHFYLLLGSGR